MFFVMRADLRVNKWRNWTLKFQNNSLKIIWEEDLSFILSLGKKFIVYPASSSEMGMPRKIRKLLTVRIIWINDSLFKFNLLSANYKTMKHTQTIRRLLLTNCLSVFDYFVGLALKGLSIYFLFSKQKLFKYCTKYSRVQKLILLVPK